VNGMSEEPLINIVARGVAETLTALREERADETVAGYALLTDDALTTLSCAAITHEGLLRGHEQDLLFSPTDWPQLFDSSALDAADRALRDAAGITELRAHVDTAFATLVQALADARARGWFAADVFLSVASTDPSPYLDSLETASVARLNEPTIVEARNRFLEKWASRGPR
jgi:hypothetical protein